MLAMTERIVYLYQSKFTDGECKAIGNVLVLDTSANIVEILSKHMSTSYLLMTVSTIQVDRHQDMI